GNVQLELVRARNGGPYWSGASARGRQLRKCGGGGRVGIGLPPPPRLPHTTWEGLPAQRLLRGLDLLHECLGLLAPGGELFVERVELLHVGAPPLPDSVGLSLQAFVLFVQAVLFGEQALVTLFQPPRLDPQRIVLGLSNRVEYPCPQHPRADLPIILCHHESPLACKVLTRAPAQKR